MIRVKVIRMCKGMIVAACVFAGTAGAEEQIVIDKADLAGMSGFRAQWDKTIPVAQDGARILKDGVVKDWGQTAVWDGEKPGPLAFDAVHRSLLVRFPGAAEKIAEALSAGKTVAKAELVLPHLDEELWPTGSGGADYPSSDGYRYRMNWDCDKLYRAQRPNWHAVAWLLRKPWQADPTNGPTYNASINGAVYWKRFGASDTTEDRFPGRLGPVEVSSYKPDGRMDVTAVLTSEDYGATLGQRLRTLSDCGFLIAKEEVYDARYFQGAYEWAVSTGPRAILIKNPSLVITLKEAKGEKAKLPPAANVAEQADKHRGNPQGLPTAVLPSPEELAKMNTHFMERPEWMPEWQFAHVRQLMGLESQGDIKPFYYRLLPQHIINRTRDVAEREAKAAKGPVPDLDYVVYLAWVDWVHGTPPRWWDGHLTGADNIMRWYNFREAMPAPMQESIIRSWNAWLMPDRESELDPKLRREYDNISGKLVHPMVDDPRVGKSKAGKAAEWNQGDTYYKATGDWRGNKSYYRSGFTREMSTANFNSSATAGALLNGQIIGSTNAMADGRAGLMTFPFWMWTHSAGVGQEYIDHYYWAIATAGNKVFADYCEQPEDKMAGWSIIEKTVNDLAGAYHPNLMKLLGPTSRTFYEHVLGVQDGLYHILHVISPRGALKDVDTGVLPSLSFATNKEGRAVSPNSAWGHDYPAATVALQSMSGPWASPWFGELVDEKPLPFSLMVEKEGDPVCTYFGENYGLSCIRQKAQRIHALGHWRRKAELPKSMSDIGTLEMRIGFNKTTIANDAEGVITQQGFYRCYQQANRFIMLAKPNPNTIKEMAGNWKRGNFNHPAEDITSVQCSTALFNFEKPSLTWKIYVDEKPVTSLPVSAKCGQVITIHDGVSYLALRPLPTDDLGRDADITLEEGNSQIQPYHEQTNIKPALFVHANFYRKSQAISADVLKQLENAKSGFVLEMGDEKEYGSFAKFQAKALKAKLATGKNGEVTYSTGDDTLVASWESFTVNGKDPCAILKEKNLCQDTSLTQMGRGRLEKNGALIERGKSHPELNLFLQTFPKQKIYVAMNLLPNYLDYTFKEPGGVKIAADGRLSMCRFAVKHAQEIDVTYHAFGGVYAPKDPAEAATVLLITGMKGKPLVTLNGKGAELKKWKDGWLLALTDAFLKDEEIATRLGSGSTKTAAAR